DVDAATGLARLFVEGSVAPGDQPQALEVLKGKKNWRLMQVAPGVSGTGWSQLEIRSIAERILRQDPEASGVGQAARVGRKRKPMENEREELQFGWRVAKHVKTNGIVLAQGGRTVGVGAGQMSRVDSVRLSIQKASPVAEGSVTASAAFFPFRDSIDEAFRA